MRKMACGGIAARNMHSGFVGNRVMQITKRRAAKPAAACQPQAHYGGKRGDKRGQ